MGLDQSLIAKVNGKNQEVHSWRKHPDMHGFFEKIWRDKCNDGQFNCVELVLTEEIIAKAESAIIRNELPHTEGFFFGESYLGDGQQADDMEAMSKASQFIKEGTTVVYSSWW